MPRTVLQGSSKFQPLNTNPGVLGGFQTTLQRQEFGTNPKKPSSFPYAHGKLPGFERKESKQKVLSYSKESKIRANRTAFQVDQAARDAMLGIKSDFDLEQQVQNTIDWNALYANSPGAGILDTQGRERTVLSGVEFSLDSNGLLGTGIIGKNQKEQERLGNTRFDHDPALERSSVKKGSGAETRQILLANKRVLQREKNQELFSAFVKEQSRDRLRRSGLGSGTALTGNTSRSPSTATTGTTLLRS